MATQAQDGSLGIGPTSGLYAVSVIRLLRRPNIRGQLGGFIFRHITPAPHSLTHLTPRAVSMPIPAVQPVESPKPHV